jgi:anti-sigma B factor antagonist
MAPDPTTSPATAQHPSVDGLVNLPDSGGSAGVAVEFGGELVLTLSGEWDIATAGLLESALGWAVRSRCGPVVVDVSGVTFMDCAGLAPLLAVGAEARPGGAVVTARGHSAALNRLLAGMAGDDSVPAGWLVALS